MDGMDYTSARPVLLIHSLSLPYISFPLPLDCLSITTTTNNTPYLTALSSSFCYDYELSGFWGGGGSAASSLLFQLIPTKGRNFHRCLESL